MQYTYDAMLMSKLFALRSGRVLLRITGVLNNLSHCKRKMNVCINPTPPKDDPGDSRWLSMHHRFVNEAIGKEPEVVFIGDSIIQQLQFCDLWNDISSLHCVNFGIGGDRVENVLWRLKNGELNFNSKIKAVVLFVGTNNVDCTPSQIFAGIVACMKEIRKSLNSCHIILPTLLPRGQNPNPLRELTSGINKLILARFAKGDNIIDDRERLSNVHVVEIDDNIIQNDATISHHVMHDYLHLTNTGYSKVFGPVYNKLCALIKKG